MMLRAIAMLAVLAAPLAAQDRSATEAAAEAAALLAEAAQALDEADRSRDRVAALTATVRAYEVGLSALRDGLRRGAIRERAIRAEFSAEAERLSRLFSVLLAMQTSPEALLLLHPAGPTETARAGMLISSVTPALQAEVAALRARLEELEQLQALQRSAAETLAAGLTGIQTARTELSQAMADRTELPARITTDSEAMQTLINSVETMDAFAGGLAALADPAEAAPEVSIASAQGVLPLPVDGIVIRGFGEADAAGVRRNGLLIATRPLALVTAPWPATIRYSGPLLDYGNVIILEPENGYLLVLAGVAEVYVTVGEVLDAGAPLGTMGGQDPDADSILVAAAIGGGEDRPETLYMELRIDQTPRNPADWFIVGAEMGPTE